MKYLVFGTGVIGSTIGWQLQARNQIAHFVRIEKIDKLRSEGIHIQCSDMRSGKSVIVKDTYRPDFISSLESIANYDACFISVKSNQLLSVLKEYKKYFTNKQVIIMQNVGLNDYQILQDMLGKQVSFAYPFIMGGGRTDNSIHCTIFNSPINRVVFGNFSGTLTLLEQEIMEEFRICKLKPAYSHNIVAYLKLHYVWATCVFASFVSNDSYEQFITVREIAKSYRAMIECFKQFKKDKIYSGFIFPYNLYHLPAIALGIYSRIIYNTKAMETMVVGHISSSPDEMKIMFNSVVEYCTDTSICLETFINYVPMVTKYFENNKVP